MSYPILEYDPSPQAVIEPRKLIKPIPIPEYAVMCFFQDVIRYIIEHKRVLVLKEDLNTVPRFFYFYGT